MSDHELLELQMEFHREMVELPKKTKKFGYYPTVFIGMVSEHGGYQAAKRLITKRQPTSGLMRLKGEKKLCLSVEATILKDKYKPLFTDEERAYCLDILDQLDYHPGEC